MLRSYHLLIALILLISLVACSEDEKSSPIGATKGTEDFSLQLDGEQAGAATQATGTALLTINKDTGALSGSVTVANTGTITVAHIHKGIAGRNGGPVVTLTPNGANASQLDIPAGTVLNASDLAALLNGELYINVHSSLFKDGEVRGQILPKDFELFIFNLEGGQETPPVVTDATGKAFVTVDGSGNVYGVVKTTGIEPTAGHIHAATKGNKGAPVVTLTADPLDATIWVIPKTALNATQLNDIKNMGMYINLHTTVNMDGELRGQIE